VNSSNTQDREVPNVTELMVFFVFTKLINVIFNPTGILNIGISLLLNYVASFTSVANFQMCPQPYRGLVKTALFARACVSIELQKC
jgi:K+-transporting ATPase A subunit